jgi:predicted nicotinamide N-methyase
MFSMAAFQRAYETERKRIVIQGRAFTLHVPRSIDAFIDPQDLLAHFPLWAKIWEGSWVLADEIARMPVEPDKIFVEIGSGVGLVGVAGDIFGHRFTVTEYDAHAIDFIQANAFENGCTQLEVHRLDWYKPDLTRRYDYVVGSEVVYSEKDFEPLRELFRKLLKPGGQIFLAMGTRKCVGTFWESLQGEYRIEVRKKVLTAGAEKIPIALIRLTAKR